MASPLTETKIFFSLSFSIKCAELILSVEINVFEQITFLFIYDLMHALFGSPVQALNLKLIEKLFYE